MKVLLLLYDFIIALAFVCFPPTTLLCVVMDMQHLPETTLVIRLYAITSVIVIYMVMLRWSMAHRWVIVLACLAALGSIPILGGKAAKNFLPIEDESQFGVSLRAPEGTSLDGTRLATFGVEYHVIPRASFESLFAAHARPTSNAGDPYASWAPTRVAREQAHNHALSNTARCAFDFLRPLVRVHVPRNAADERLVALEYAGAVDDPAPTLN